MLVSKYGQNTSQAREPAVSHDGSAQTTDDNGAPRRSQAAARAKGSAPAQALAQRLDKTIVLVGLMGAGKSCVGKRLAACLGLPFVDADREIEEAAGCSISDYFAAHGEKTFRDGERRVIQRLLGNPMHVLATGGGAFMDAETRARTKACGVSIWLKADLETLLARTARRSNRPLLKRDDPRKVLEQLMALRHPHYETADITVESTDSPLNDTVAKVMQELERHFRLRAHHTQGSAA